jgi:predicted Zn-dependent peptidase
LDITPAKYISRVEQVTREKVAQVARSLEMNTVYFLKGVG